LESAATIDYYRDFKGHSYVANAVAFSPDGKYLVSASSDQQIISWDVSTGGKLWQTKSTVGPVYSAAVSPDGKYLVTSSMWSMNANSSGKPNRVSLWNPVTGEEIRAFRNVGDYAKRLYFSPDSRMFLGVFSHEADLWDVNNTDAPVRAFYASDTGTFMAA